MIAFEKQWWNSVYNFFVISRNSNFIKKIVYNDF